MKEEKTVVQQEAIDKETRAFVCPVCDSHLQFRVRVQVTSVGLTMTGEESAERDGKPVAVSAKTREQREAAEQYKWLLSAAKEYGVFDAFNKTLELANVSTAGGAPINRDDYFIKWFRKAARQNVPMFALRQCLNGNDSGGRLELWGWQNVSVILQDGTFKTFIPRQIANGDAIEELSFESGSIKKKEPINLKIWIRTKYGYIERGGEFASEMRKHSVGGFQLR